MLRGMLGFVGRERELAVLDDALADARAGRGGVYLLSGPAGIGKSRLAEEVAAHAQNAEMVAVWGRAWEAGGAPAYWPLVQALRSAIRGREDSEAVRARAGALGQLLPELRSADATAAGGTRFELLDAVGGTFIALARQTPLVVVLEDLHAADVASLSLLHLVTGQLRSEPLLVLGTMRSPAASDPEAAALLARIAQDAHTVPLSPLGREQVLEVLQQMLGRVPDDALVDSACERTEGNALFLVELARHLISRRATAIELGAAVPPTVTTAIRARLADLSETASSVLERAAVVGREFTCGELGRAFDIDGPQLQRALDEAEAAALVDATAPGAYRFGHILVREVLHAGLDEDRRRAYHLRLARALTVSARDEDARWSQIALHFSLGGEDGRAETVDAAERAALQAARALAFEDADASYDLALSALDEETEHAALRRGELLVGKGCAQLQRGEIEAGRRTCAEAADIGSRIGAARLLAEAALAYGSVMVFAEVDPKLVALLERAIAAQKDGRTALRARLLARLAAAKQPAADPREPIQIALEAIALAREVGDERTLEEVLRVGCSSMMDLEIAEVRTPLNREHVALAEAAGHVADAFQGHVRLVVDSVELGDRVGVESAIRSIQSIAADLDRPRFLWRARAASVLMDLWSGRFEDAERGIVEARELGRIGGDPNAPTTCAWQQMRLLRLTGRHDELAEQLPEFSQVLAGTPVHESHARIGAAVHLLLLGRAEEAIRGLDLAEALRIGATSDGTVIEAVCELAHAAGDAELAGYLLRRFGPRAERFVSTGVIGMTWDAPIHRSVALCKLTLGDVDAGLEALSAGIAATRELGGLPMVAWMLVEKAEAAVAAGRDLDDALRCDLAEGREIAARLGMRGIVERADALADPRSTAHAPSAADPVDFSLEHEGELWTVTHAGRRYRLKDTKGLRLLARLVEERGREIHVLDLIGSGQVDRGDAGEMLDETARAQYAARVQALRAELAEAEEWNDRGRIEAATHELEAIQAELARAVGLGGRERRSGSAVEKARVNVQRRLRDAIKRIESQDEPLGRHLARAVRTGRYCAYDPA